MSPKPFLAPSLVKLRDEINAEWPHRDKRSDGWIGDKAHQQRVSDHNPDSRGMVHAIDVDKDGVDPTLIVDACIADSRVHYVIWNHFIYESELNFKAKAYTGPDPHTGHIHISINHNTHSEESTSDWLDTLPTPEDVWNYKLVNQNDSVPDSHMSAGDMLGNIEVEQDRQFTELSAKLDAILAAVKGTK